MEGGNVLHHVKMEGELSGRGMSGGICPDLSCPTASCRALLAIAAWLHEMTARREISYQRYPHSLKKMWKLSLTRTPDPIQLVGGGLLLWINISRGFNPTHRQWQMDWGRYWKFHDNCDRFPVIILTKKQTNKCVSKTHIRQTRWVTNMCNTPSPFSTATFLSLIVCFSYSKLQGRPKNDPLYSSVYNAALFVYIYK